MDSSDAKHPPIASTAAAIASASSPVQESPFSNFISSLSPINPVKASHAIQGCLALNSPPLVFSTPRANTIREANLLERLQPLSGDSILGRDGGNMTGDGTTSSSRIESSVIQFQEAFVADTKDDGSGKSLQVQSSDSSGSVIGYLTDPVDPDCLNSADSSCTNSKLSVKWLESSVDDHVGSENTAQEFHKKNVADSEAETFIMSLKTKFDEEFEKNLSSSEEESRESERPHHECMELLSVPIKLTQKPKNCQVQNDGNDRSEGYSQRLDLTLQVVPRNEVPAEKVEATSNRPTDPEVSQHQRGISRRCLQFGEAEGNAKAQGLDVSNLFTDALPSNSLSIAYTIEGSDPNCADLSASQKIKLVNIAQTSVDQHTINNSMKSPLTFSKPSGIGLHLNSIVSSIPMASPGTESMKLVSQENLNSAYSLERTKSSMNSVDETVPIVKAEALETRDFTTVGGSYEPVSSEEQMEHHTTPDTKRKCTLDHPENHEECDQQSTKKKRKKSSSTVDEDGCKHCNCKKSKCLKLYCDCFAAGIYCSGVCSCRECFNRPEYRDRVLETRFQIESRNPLAFAPKIIQHNVSSPINGRVQEDGNLTTPSTARHQRGCNCKRSMCQKKYCECYQANVGCSAGCRCEGCKNIYGTREGYLPSEELMSSGFYCDTLNGKLEVAATKQDHILNELPNPSYHIPLTPSLPCSENKNKASETCFLARCPTSPESGLTVLSSYAKSSRNSRNIDVVLESCKDTSADENHSQRMDLNDADACHLSPMSNCPSAPMASASSKASGLSNATQFQFRASGGISGRSLHWHSPLTPVSQPDGPKKLQEPSSDVGSCCIMEDDTPELLKDVSIPGKPVKASSPTGKRVSPPHTILEIGSSCSGRLRSGRKFILKAIPSFPPLTPCVGLKGSNNEDSIIKDADSNH